MRHGRRTTTSRPASHRGCSHPSAGPAEGRGPRHGGPGHRPPPVHDAADRGGPGRDQGRGDGRAGPVEGTAPRGLALPGTTRCAGRLDARAQFHLDQDPAEPAQRARRPAARPRNRSRWTTTRGPGAAARPVPSAAAETHVRLLAEAELRRASTAPTYSWLDEDFRRAASQPRRPGCTGSGPWPARCSGLVCSTAWWPSPCSPTSPRRWPPAAWRRPQRLLDAAIPSASEPGPAEFADWPVPGGRFRAIPISGAVPAEWGGYLGEVHLQTLVLAPDCAMIVTTFVSTWREPARPARRWAVRAAQLPAVRRVRADRRQGPAVPAGLPDGRGRLAPVRDTGHLPHPASRRPVAGHAGRCQRCAPDPGG